LRLAELLDDAYPEAVTLFDGLLRHAERRFRPRYDLGEEALRKALGR
jgi:hypothetical protein